jgi:predicted O-methyltransferase YrrM
MKSYVDKVFTDFEDCKQVYDELCAFEVFLREYRPNNILEIGTYTGGTFWLMCQYSTGYKVSIDIVPPEYKEQRQQQRKFSDNVILIDSSSQNPETVNTVIQQTRYSRFDLIFIDGDHTFDKVMEDFNIYSKLLSERGVVVFHDINPDHANKNEYGVRQVWEGLIGKKIEIISKGRDPKINKGYSANTGGIGIWKPFNYIY